MSVAELNELAVAALKRAMRAKGIEGNTAALARLLRQEVGDGPDPTTVGRWLKGEQTVPAWALLAASRASKVAPTDLVLPEPDIADLKRVVDGLLQQMAQLRSAIAAAQSGSQEGSDGNLERRLAQIADVIARLQDTVETQGQLLDRVAKEVLPARSRSSKAVAPEGAARESG